MDSNTASVLVAGIGAVVALATLSVNMVILVRTNQTHGLVNGLAHEKSQLLELAAVKEGELRGRDFNPPPPILPS